MKISKLITRLEQMRGEHGDLPVETFVDWNHKVGWCDIDLHVANGRLEILDDFLGENE